MKKILLAIDANEVNIKGIDFACYIARLTHSKLTGVFIENPEEISVKEKLWETAYVNLIAQGVPQKTSNTALHEENIRIFEEACKARSVNYYIQYDKGDPMKTLITESRFADLLIIEPVLSFNEKPVPSPSNFVKEILSKSECPVILTPFEFNGIDEILFTYDGSASSVFSIRQFNYLFPDLTDTKVIVLQINEEEDMPVIEKDKISGLLQNYYSAVGYKTVQGTPESALFDYLLGKKNVFVVMGAFGRSTLSDFFKHSTAELIVKTLDLPFFIAHL